MKIRLDQYLVQHGMIQSRERAKALIMAGVVFVNEQKVDKAGEMIKEDAKVEVRGHDIGYVSRGGLKLEKAMQCFPLTPNGKVCMAVSYTHLDVYKRQACICAELLSRFVGQGWGQKCIKAVAGLYILVVFADALPGAKAQFTALELPQVSAVSVGSLEDAVLAQTAEELARTRCV